MALAIAAVGALQDTLKDTFLTWPPAVSFARRTALSMFSGLETGSLLIIDETMGVEHIFDQKITIANGKDVRSIYTIPEVRIVVKRDSFWLRLILFADIGFAEGYMLGDLECNDLTSFFRIFIMNRKKLNDGMTSFSVISSMISRLGRPTNTLAHSLLNAAAHYDISNDMFAAFLSEDMTYSCPIWQPLDDGEDNTETLEDAQLRKLLRFIEGAKLRVSDHVLEIGTGWGSFAIEAVKRSGCRVTSVTLSLKQKELAEKRIKLAGLSHRIEVKFMDYREIPVPAKLYDKIVSIEMVECVGEDHLAVYFGCVDKLLKRDGGIAMFQSTIIPEAQHAADAKKRHRFICQYIFPGGYLPSIMQLLEYINTQSKGTLSLERIENIGGHYIKTLRLWRENFKANFDHRIKPALLQSHPDMSDESIEVFQRKWEYYFAYCEAGFFTKTLGVVIITVSRPGALELIEGLQL